MGAEGHVRLLCSCLRDFLLRKKLSLMPKARYTNRPPVEVWCGRGGTQYEHEPDITEDLKKLDNVILQPHSASATFNSRRNMAILAAKNMIAGLKGEIPPNCINPEVFNK